MVPLRVTTDNRLTYWNCLLSVTAPKEKCVRARGFADITSQADKALKRLADPKPLNKENSIAQRLAAGLPRA
jgi:hypothetical protein